MRDYQQDLLSSHHQFIRVPVSSHTCQHLLYSSIPFIYIYIYFYFFSFLGQGQGSNLCHLGCYSDSLTVEPWFLVLIVTTLVHMKWYLIVVFIIISVMTNDVVEHLFMSLWIFVRLLCKNGYFFGHFKLDCLWFCYRVVSVHIFWICDL